MEILNTDEQGALERVIVVLREGGVAVLPTDTVYGLVADATNEEAVKNIFEIKGREDGKPLPIFVSGIEMAKEYADISPKQERFLEAVWPGAVTVIFISPNGSASLTTGNESPPAGGSNKRIAKEVAGGKGTIGMRVPDDEFLQKILREMGIPLAQTSANVSGMPPARSAEEVRVCFKAVKCSPNILLDGGVRAGDASSVIDLSGSVPLVLREGAFPKARLFELLRDSGFSGFSGL